MRVGKKMREVQHFVRQHPGCCKLAAARYVAPYGVGICYGYRTVDRAIRAGLVTAELGKGGRYVLRVAEPDSLARVS